MSVFYSKEHEWAKIDGKIATIGISDYAAHQLGDITFVDLPKVGKTVKQFEIVCSVESVKAASDIYSPLSGKVIEVNTALENEPQVINSDAENGGWFVRLEISDTAETANLMNQVEYQDYIKSL